MISGRLGPRRGAPLAALALAASLAACASAPPPASPQPWPSAPPPVPHPAPRPAPADPGPGPRPYYPEPPPGRAVADLPGWAAEDHAAALVAYAAGCHLAEGQVARATCERARRLLEFGRPPPELARAFFETSFTIEPMGGEGLLTSYFAPEYQARHRRTAEFDAPILGVPYAPAPWPDRAAIEAGEIDAPILGWMRAEDLFFLQIQGSGYLTFADGSRARAAYAANNGHDFVGIARPMAERGLLPRDGTSGAAIARWLAQHRGPEARAIMDLNPRYIFFSVQPDDGGHPAGAAGVPLAPGRAIAVDPDHWDYGEPVWIVADGGNLVGARRGYRGLVMALDTGSAIRGRVRADYYMGRGEAAGDEAGTVRHPLRMWRLVPRG